MAQQLSIVTYGNGDILRELFNAVAASMGDSTFQTLIHLTLLLAGTWAMAKLIFKRDIMVGVGWIALYFMAFYVIFLPKVTVNIVDRVNQDQPYVVDNVPLGLAWLANLTSTIGDSLTQLIEQNFSLPDDLRYGQTGMVMASNLVTAASTFQVTDPDFEQNLQSFITQCVFYDVLLHKYSAQDLLTTTDIWQFVTQHASPARAFLYNQAVVTCKDGIQSLNQDWQAAIDQAEERYGARLFPDDTQAKTQLLKYLPVSYNFLTNLSEDASNLMQQNMMANAIQSGLLNWSARTNAPAALEGYAFNKAQQQNRIGNRTIGDMAAYWLPLLKNVFEGILYGSFIFIFLLLCFPFGPMVLRQYAYSLLWLQLWAPLYAIINLYVNFYAQHRSLSAITLTGGVQGLVLATQSGLAQVNSDMSGLAGYLSLSVPLIATSLVTGLHQALSHLGQYVGGAIQSGSTTGASEAASGSFNLANTSLSTHNAYNTSANHFDTTARTASGSVTDQMPGGSTITMTPDGSVVMNNQPATSSLNTQVHLAEAIRSSASEQADQSYSAALSHQQSYNEAISVAERGVYELSRHQALSEASGASFVTSRSAGDSQALSDLQQESSRQAHEHSASDSASSNRAMEIGLNANVGVGMPSESPLKASGSLHGGVEKTWNHTASEQNSYSHSQDSLQNANVSQNVDTVLRGVAEGSYRANTEEGKRILDSISTSLDRAHQEQQQASAQFQQAETYRKMASISEEEGVTINSNATQEFMNDLQKEGHSLREIEKSMVDHPEQAQAQAEKFIHHKVQAYFEKFKAQDDSSRVSIEEGEIRNTEMIKSEEISHESKEIYEKEKSKLQSDAHRQGLDKKSIIDKRPAEGVGKMIVEDNKEIQEKQKEIDHAQKNVSKGVNKNQKRIREEARLGSSRSNQLDQTQE